MQALRTGSDDSARDIFGRFWSFTAGDRRRLAAAGFFIVLVAASEAGTVLIFDAVTNTVLAHGNLAAFWTLAADWLGIAVVAAAAMYAAGYLMSVARERFLLRLRDGVFSHAQRLSLDFFGKRRLGDLMVRLIDDVGAVEALVSSGLAGAAASVVSVLVFAAVAVAIRWDLALVAFAVAPLFWLASKGFAGRLSRAASRERAASGSITSAVEESLSNQALVQAFNRQSDQARHLHQQGLSWQRAKLAESRLTALYAPVVYVIETLCILVVFGFGAWEVADRRISVGGMLSFAILLTYIYPQIQALSGYRVDLAEGRASARRITEILHFRPAVTDRGAIRAEVRGRGQIRFDNVTFSYPGRNSITLDGLSFTAAPGRMLAITGPSGSGKSTIARLLLRFYDPGGGHILLDGIDIRDLSLQNLRHNITLLQQETLLFTGTVRDNIAYGMRDATDGQVRAAARAAGADDFIQALPRGYGTAVGERGRLLSGGQRQRIAIARAVLRDAPVLILDEPTTGLDTAAARRLLALLSPVTAGRTTILITHDLALTAAADDILAIGDQRPRPLDPPPGTGTARSLTGYRPSFPAIAPPRR